MLQAPTKKYDNEFKLLGTKLNYLSTAVRDLGKDKADIARFEEVEKKVNFLTSFKQIQDWQNSVTESISRFESKMTAHNLQMQTNADIIGRFDEILCEKVSKQSLIEV